MPVGFAPLFLHIGNFCLLFFSPIFFLFNLAYGLSILLIVSKAIFYIVHQTFFLLFSIFHFYFIDSLLCNTTWKHSSDDKLVNCRSHLVCFAFLGDHILVLPVVQYLIKTFIHFVQEFSY